MRYFFETQITHFLNKKIKDTYLVTAHSFTEAEANMTQYLEDKEIKSFEVTAMKRNAFEDTIYRTEDEETGDFFEVKVRVKFESEAKEYNYKYLVAGENIEDVTGQIKTYIEDNMGTPKVTQVKQLNITDLVITKECKENGTIIIGFDHQKEIERRVLAGEEMIKAVKALKSHGGVKVSIIKSKN